MFGKVRPFKTLVNKNCGKIIIRIYNNYYFNKDEKQRSEIDLKSEQSIYAYKCVIDQDIVND